MFDNVLVGVDGRSGGRDAITLAKLLAGPRARIILNHVYGSGWPLVRGADKALEAERRAAEQLLARERDLTSVDAVLEPVRAPSVAHALHGREPEPDLVVIGSCRRGGLGRILLGDDTASVLDGAVSPTAVAPRDYTAPATLTRIGIGHDNSPEAIRGLEVARVLARAHDARISALSVVSLDSIPKGEPVPADWSKVAGDLVDNEAQRLDAFADVDVDAVYGDPAEELARFGEDLDLLIVGSRGLSALGRLIHGSASEYLARRAQCPLLVIPRGAEVNVLEAPIGTYGTARSPS